MDTRHLERKIAIAARLTTLLAVMASTVGAVLMTLVGVNETVNAIRVQFAEPDALLPAGDVTAIHLIGALDRFLMAIVLLYFAFGIYQLFLRPE